MNNSQSTIVNHKTLSLDPSSKVIGWAVMTGAGSLSSGGLILPPKKSAPYVDRVRAMRADLLELLGTERPATILIEIPSGKVHRRKREFTYGTGLSVYGFGVGAIATECEYWAADNRVDIVTIFESDWTRGVPKRDRQLAIAAMFDQYRVGDDPGADMADAIGMGVWWFRQTGLFSMALNQLTHQR